MTAQMAVARRERVIQTVRAPTSHSPTYWASLIGGHPDELVSTDAGRLDLVGPVGEVVEGRAADERDHDLGLIV
jgi:hypothetical protein